MPKKHHGILKENNGKWMIHTRIAMPNGDNVTITKRGFDTEGAAFEQLEKIKQSKYEEYISSKRPLLWADAAKEYWDYYSTKVKETTAKNCFSTFNKHIIKPFRKLSVIEMMKIENIKTLKENINKSNIKDQTHKNKILRFMRGCVNFHYQRGNITPEEFKRANIELEPFYTSGIVKKEKQTWTLQEFQTFLDSFDKNDRYYILFEIMGHTGCRVGEIRGMQVKSFDRQNKSIYIRYQVSSKLGDNKWKLIDPKTPASIRHISLSDRICNLLGAFIDDMGYKDDDFIFFGKNPVGCSTIKRQLLNHIKISNVKTISPHCIRHSNTTWLLNNPNLSLEDIAIISRRLGHESKKVTLDIYYHIQKETNSTVILDALL